MCIEDVRLDNVTSRDGRAVRDHLIAFACSKGWHLLCRGRQGTGRGTFVPHVQFRRRASERPYPFSLNLNAMTPTFYVRRPDAREREHLVAAFAGAHENRGEIKIPVPDRETAQRVAERFLT